MEVAYDIKAIMHEILANVVKLDLPLIAFIKVLYPTYSHDLESLQPSGKLKYLDFDTLVEKIAKREKNLQKEDG